jgi:F0F1-type ATP synthase membrane subunit b/b'
MEETLAKILTAEKTAEATIADAKATAETKLSTSVHSLEVAYEKKLVASQAKADAAIKTFSDVDVCDHVKEEKISVDVKKASTKVLDILYDS